MQNLTNNAFVNIFPYFTYVANRKCSTNWAFKGEPVHNRHNLILVYAGEAVLTCNDKTYKVKSGDLIYYKPGDYRVGHTFADNPMKCYTVDFLYVIPELINDEWDLSSLDLPFQTVETIKDSFLFSRLLELFVKFTRTYLGQNKNQVIRGRAIFTEILSLLTQWKSGDFIYDNVRKVEQVINYMTDNYSKPLTLAKLSDSIKISPSYLGSIFKSVTGKSPITYLLEIRIHKAKELLKDGHSVSHVSEEVGFNDLFYFSKCFKKYEGISPSHYKQISYGLNDFNDD